MSLKIQALDKKHEKNDFACGHSLLDNYLKKQAGQDVSRNLSACFVLVDGNNTVKGYYTLSANSISKNEFPDALQKKMPPSYQELPTTLLGRLAIDSSLKDQGLGKILLMDALNRTAEVAESIGILALVVDPIDEEAQNFYARYGFILLPTSGKMFLPMKTITALLK